MIWLGATWTFMAMNVAMLWLNGRTLRRNQKVIKTNNENMEWIEATKQILFAELAKLTPERQLHIDLIERLNTDARPNPEG